MHIIIASIINTSGVLLSGLSRTACASLCARTDCRPLSGRISYIIRLTYLKNTKSVSLYQSVSQWRNGGECAIIKAEHRLEEQNNRFCCVCRQSWTQTYNQSLYLLPIRSTGFVPNQTIDSLTQLMAAIDKFNYCYNYLSITRICFRLQMWCSRLMAGPVRQWCGIAHIDWRAFGQLWIIFYN